jgi:protein-S-isoprenylcysteine O-methyltransferase Ste14
MRDMNQIILLRIAFGAILISVIGIRIYYMKSMSLPSQGQKEKAKKNSIGFRLIMLFGFSLIAISLTNPSWMAWSFLQLPLWVRWCGVMLGAVAALLLFWVHHSLGKNFSSRVRIRQEHGLCISGPYRWVRHPMYTVLYLLSIAWLIATASWLVGLFWLAVQTIIIAPRIHREEAVLLEHFGDEYRSYMLKTGRFLPRVRLP